MNAGSAHPRPQRADVSVVVPSHDAARTLERCVASALASDEPPLEVIIADDASTEVQSPENYTFTIGIKPQPSAQSLTVATSSTKHVVKAWGVTSRGSS